MAKFNYKSRLHSGRLEDCTACRSGKVCACCQQPFSVSTAEDAKTFCSIYCENRTEYMETLSFKRSRP